ncbi:hypothetical protein E1293_44300 [Actinomadura darangshiensis]|uniref:Uncharacterized protein n=1 Tax=Actinomadura darangshiensis TaxID=705336 RepID=A0A4R4ZT56_9ACTN|nr:hypothetical protein [Actinomadura darangshiensis]TDD62243.1 hypothetical protein E1293_44300 [Actinomadura darangshiensis]
MIVGNGGGWLHTSWPINVSSGQESKAPSSATKHGWTQTTAIMHRCGRGGGIGVGGDLRKGPLAEADVGLERSIALIEKAAAELG